MMKLYWSPRSRAFTALWMMEEAGQPYERVLTDIATGAQKKPEYLAINPMGKVPALQDGEATMGEAAAICAYVAERCPDAKLAPPVGDPRRARYLYWLFFAPSCIEPAIIQLFTSGKQKDFYNMTNDTLKTVGPILFVTAAGGVLGKVISSSDMVNFITAHANALQTIGIFFPFLLAAILKTAQGSSTVGLTTSAGIVAPLLSVLGFTTPVEIALVVMAIGAGAMTVSHANDSYFWVVTNFGEMQPEEGYKTQTLMTLIIGLASMVEIFILSLIF